MNYPTNTWQELNWSPVYGSDDFFEFCSNVTDADMPANLTAVDNQLAQYSNGEAWTGLGGWSNYVKQYLIPICGGEPINSVYCFGTQNRRSTLYPNKPRLARNLVNSHAESYWADIANSGGRSYLYTCESSNLPAELWPTNSHH